MVCVRIFIFFRGTILIQWDDYLSARKSGIKRQWKPLLEKNIRAFESMQGKTLKIEIHEMCVAYFDKDCIGIPIQHPRIFEKVLAQLIDEINLDNEKYLLWAYKAIGLKDVYKTIQIEKPEQLLERAIELNPNNYEAKNLLMLEYIDSLDFALHELPHGLRLGESICINLIQHCEKLIDKNPELSDVKTRFGGNFEHYKSLYFSWIEYQEKEIKEDFFQWNRSKKNKLPKLKNNHPEF